MKPIELKLDESGLWLSEDYKEGGSTLSFS